MPKQRDLTSGGIFKNILYFSLPFLLSYFLQTFYGLADLFIIGRYGSIADTTAVSIGGQVMHMLTVMIVSLAMGATVLIGKAVGGKKKGQKNMVIGNTTTLFILLSVVLTVVLLLCCTFLVRLMATPAEAVEGTTRYLLICFAGIPFITAYNIISSIYRGLGDSKSPMYFVVVACVFNIVFDLVFIGGLGWGPTGAALGTVLAQTISLVLALAFTIRKQTIEGLDKFHFKLRRKVTGKIIRIGLPVCAQDCFIQISFILITIFANQRGLNDAAAVGIVEKLIGILFLIPSSLLSSVSTLCAQNIGAGHHDRVRKTLYYSVALASGFGFFFSVIFQFVSPHFVALFTNEPDVIGKGAEYLRSYVWDCLFAGVHFCFTGYFCAYGRSEVAFVHNTLSIILARVPLAYLASIYYASLYPMGWAAPIGSIISIIVCMVAYKWLKLSTAN
ncbi:MAG: MATE family efflux transporter [Paludibacteraceae bacterium]|nr:MATE family efflux transporter [Paludibacteraceae bacterium]